MFRFLVAELVRPYIRAELPGWGKVYKYAVGDHRKAALWVDAGPRIVRDKRHGYYRIANICEWADRSLYFLGRWYDLSTALAAQAALRPKDRVVDVGANYGHFTMAAAAGVGPEGHVVSAEPNPVAFARLSTHLALNRLDQVDARNHGVADAPGELTLRVPKINSGEASFAPSAYDAVTEVTCPVVTLDRMVGTAKVDLIKIDAEGFEVKVLRGAATVLERDRPIVITEVVEAHLTRAGATRGDLFALLEPLGYRAYRLGLRREGFRHGLSLTPHSAEGPDANVIWVPETGRARLGALLPG